MTTTIHVTIDKVTKQKAQKLAKEMGLDLSTIVKASLKNFVETETFHVEKTHRMTPYLERVIEQANKDYAKGINWSGPFNTPEEIEKHLKKLMK